MIDAEGFRPNVGIMLMNTQGKLLWARRIGGQNAWQFPQGGIKSDETPEQALYRELKEEVGLSPEQVSVVDVTRGWLRYRLPKRFVRQQQPVCIGQKQKWFLLEYNGADNAIDLKRTQELVELSKPLPFTFHRAFDEVSNPKEALAQLIDLGIDRVLTSGQKSSAEEGLVLLTELNKIANGRITILAGGGINSDNASKFKAIGLKEIHASASVKVEQENESK